jgi:hypothetical protein
MPLRKIDERVGPDGKPLIVKQKDKKRRPPKGLDKDTTTSAYGDAGRGRPVPKFKEGGVCRGAGAAVKGTKFEGVF